MYKKNSGFSLVELMAASTILIIGLIGGTLIAQKAFITENTLSKLSQIEILRRLIRVEFSCRQSLNIDINLELPQLAACPAPNKTLPILGRDGTEIFSMYLNGEFYKLGSWHLRAKCDNNRVLFEGRLANITTDTSKGDTLYGQWRDIFSGTSLFCREYLTPKAALCTTAPYIKFYAGNAIGSQCCRVASNTALGNATATCSAQEVMVNGGGFCASSLTSSSLLGETRNRKVVQTSIMGGGGGMVLGGTTMVAMPFIPHFMFPRAPIIANLFAPYENISATRGGFLTKNIPEILPNGTLASWSAGCKSDDWLDDFTTTAYAVCCPKRW